MLNLKKKRLYYENLMKNSMKSTNYIYPAIFTPEKEGGYYIHFPDIDNCFTCGDDIEDGMLMAEDALGKDVDMFEISEIDTDSSFYETVMNEKVLVT